jgi:hypothetical protein
VARSRYLCLFSQKGSDDFAQQPEAPRKNSFEGKAASPRRTPSVSVRHKRRNSRTGAKPPAMSAVELERRLVKSLQELWDEVASEAGLSRWLGGVRVSAMEPPHRLEWDTNGASGVIELEESGWGTKVRLRAETERAPAWERLHARYAVERSLWELLDALSANSLKAADCLLDPRPSQRLPTP